MLITDLDSLVSALSPQKRERFERLFHFDATKGYLNPPPSMTAWIEKQFGSVDVVREQKIIKVTNRVTYEGALFNKLRASRPIETIEKLAIEARIIDVIRDDPFSNPVRDTPEDVFGRIEGKYCVTASNIAKYDGHHGIIIFREANPLHFTKDQVADYIDTACLWAEKIRELDSGAKYFFFLWNCLRRAGASMIHGHAQVSLTRIQHYAKVEGLRFAAERYQRRYKSNYFHDLYEAHHDLGLGFEKQGVKVMAYITPLKEKDVMLLSNKLDLSLKERTYEALACLRDNMNVTAFNLCLVVPPSSATTESWEGFPAVVRIVDRGESKSTSCDIGTMELFGQSVVSSDPLEVARLLKESLS
ncbi:MAG: hypothetical protein Q8P00_04610 [Dehalococcoidia bacterium]|nr:hypothetical protein [Dehalococcoidia bacterium]